jgi:hypothetical protein
METKSTKWLVPQPLAFRVPSELSAEDAVSWLTAELLAHGFRIGIYEDGSDEPDGQPGIYEVTRAQH